MRRGITVFPFVVMGALLAGLSPAGARQADSPKILRSYWDAEFHEILEPQMTEGGAFYDTHLVKPHDIGFASAGVNQGWSLFTSPLDIDIAPD